MTPHYEYEEWAGFVEGIRKDPEDDTIRLAAADWLEENGFTGRAMFIRTQIQMVRELRPPLKKLHAITLIVHSQQQEATPLSSIYKDDRKTQFIKPKDPPRVTITTGWRHASGILEDDPIEVHANDGSKKKVWVIVQVDNVAGLDGDQRVEITGSVIDDPDTDREKRDLLHTRCRELFDPLWLSDDMAGASRSRLWERGFVRYAQLYPRLVPDNHNTRRNTRAVQGHYFLPKMRKVEPFIEMQVCYQPQFVYADNNLTRKYRLVGTDDYNWSISLREILIRRTQGIAERTSLDEILIFEKTFPGIKFWYTNSPHLITTAITGIWEHDLLYPTAKTLKEATIKKALTTTCPSCGKEFVSEWTQFVHESDYRCPECQYRIGTNHRTE